MFDNTAELPARFAALEEFIVGRSRRVIYALGKAMAATFCLAEVVNILSHEKTIEKFSMGKALINADAALDKEQAVCESKTQDAIDHARLLLKAWKSI